MSHHQVVWGSKMDLQSLRTLWNYWTVTHFCFVTKLNNSTVLTQQRVLGGGRWMVFSLMRDWLIGWHGGRTVWYSVAIETLCGHCGSRCRRSTLSVQLKLTLPVCLSLPLAPSNSLTRRKEEVRPSWYPMVLLHTSCYRSPLRWGNLALISLRTSWPQCSKSFQIYLPFITTTQHNSLTFTSSSTQSIRQF